MQAAALAEFRANMNYETALRTYQTAYQELARIQPPAPSALQRFAELAAVAEQIHLKVPFLVPSQLCAAMALLQRAEVPDQ